MPGSPAATHGKTVVGTAAEFTTIGGDHVALWSVEYDSIVSVRVPPCRSFHTRYRLPARSTSIAVNESNVSPVAGMDVFVIVPSGWTLAITTLSPVPSSLPTVFHVTYTSPAFWSATRKPGHW